MKVAELFINLGIAGGSTVGKSLGEVSKGMNSLYESSLATKAAILASIYALERLTGWASKAGFELDAYQISTGQSADQLQRWQYALGKAGVSGEQTMGMFQGLTDLMASIKSGTASLPEGFSVFANAVGLDMEKASKDTGYFAAKIKEFIEKTKNNPAVARKILSGMNIDPKMYQGLLLMDGRIDKISKKRILNRDEIKNLREINAQWFDFWNTLEAMGKKFIGSEAFKKIFGGFGSIGTAGLDVLGSVGDFIEKLMGLEDFSSGFSGIIEAIATPLRMLAALFKYLGEQVDLFKKGKEIFGGMFSGGLGNMFSTMVANANKGMGATPATAGGPSFSGGYMPKMSLDPSTWGARGGSSVTVNNNTVNHITGDDPRAIGAAVAADQKKQTSNALFQSSAQGVGAK